MTVAIPTKLLAERLRCVRETLAAHRVDLLFVTPGADLRYLLGITGESHERFTCLMLPAEGHRATPALVVPTVEAPRLVGQSLEELGVELVTWLDGEDPYLLLSGFAGAPTTIGIVDTMPAVHLFGISDVLPSSIPSLAGPVLRELRMRKDAAEVDQLRTAAVAIDRVHARMGEFMKVGRTEAQIGVDIATAIVEEGHTSVAFVIVGSGPNAASPHHEVSDRVIEDGDIVVVDIGGSMPSGYFSDCTRTYVVGARPSAAARKAYAVLQDAQERAIAAVRPGVTAGSVDAAARKPIVAAGLGDRFVHRTGHGIGLDVHEEPYIVSGNTLELEPGMAFSVEPGIYFNGEWGARIEDIVVVTADGCERLNTRPRDLVVL